MKVVSKCKNCGFYHAPDRECPGVLAYDDVLGVVFHTIQECDACNAANVAGVGFYAYEGGDAIHVCLECLDKSIKAYRNGKTGWLLND